MISQEVYDKLHREVVSLNKRKFKESKLKREIRSLKEENALLWTLLNESRKTGKTNDQEMPKL